MGGVKTLMGLGDGFAILWIVVLPFFLMGYGKVSNSLWVLVRNRIMTKMG